MKTFLNTLAIAVFLLLAGGRAALAQNRPLPDNQLRVCMGTGYRHFALEGDPIRGVYGDAAIEYTDRHFLAGLSIGGMLPSPAQGGVVDLGLRLGYIFPLGNVRLIPMIQTGAAFGQTFSGSVNAFGLRMEIPIGKHLSLLADGYYQYSFKTIFCGDPSSKSLMAGIGIICFLNDKDKR